jgi:putative membrane protein
MIAAQRNPSSRYPLVLLAAFAVVWVALGIAPRYRQDWLLENVLVLIAVPLLAVCHARLRFSDSAYTCLFAFLLLHEIGAHFTYSEVPLPVWLTGTGPDGVAASRNHFDRIVHFLYGVLITPMAVELLDARAPQRGTWRWLLPWLFVVSHATLFEIVEAAAAGVFGGDLGEAYLGTQGDVWDSQKDSALAAVGAFLAVVCCRWGEPRG